MTINYQSAIHSHSNRIATTQEHCPPKHYLSTKYTAPARAKERINYVIMTGVRVLDNCSYTRPASRNRRLTHYGPGTNLKFALIFLKQLLPKGTLGFKTNLFPYHQRERSHREGTTIIMTQDKSGTLLRANLSACLPPLAETQFGTGSLR